MAEQSRIPRAVASANEQLSPELIRTPPELKQELVGTLDTKEAIRELFISGVYPYVSKMTVEEYEATKREL